MFNRFLKILTTWVLKFEFSRLHTFTLLGAAFFTGGSPFHPDSDAIFLNWFFGFFRLVGVIVMVVGLFGICVHLRDMADKEKKEKHDSMA